MTNFSENLSYLFSVHGFANQIAMAKALGMNRSSLSRLLSGARLATPAQRKLIVAYFKLQQSDLDLDHLVFRSTVGNLAAKSDLTFLAFRSTRQNVSRWSDI